MKFHWLNQNKRRKLSLALFQKLTLKSKELTQLLCHADASKVNDGAKDRNEILLLLNVCPDEIKEDSDKAYESDFEDD